MEEIKNLIASPAFWFASVFMAFLMSLFAGYVKDWTDRWLVVRTQKRDLEAKLRQKNFEEKVVKLTENPHFLSLYQTNIIYQKLRQVLYLLAMYVFLGLTLLSIVRFDFIAAIVLQVFSLFFFIEMHIVTRRLTELRSVVNKVLGDDEAQFVG